MPRFQLTRSLSQGRGGIPFVQTRVVDLPAGMGGDAQPVADDTDLTDWEPAAPSEE